MESGVSVLGAAVSWGAGLVTGSLATAIAVMAVAGLGFSLVQGRLDVRLAMRIVLGCFIVFAAPLIASAILGVAKNLPAPRKAATPVVSTVLTAPPPPQYDPYAGAVMPHAH